MFPFKKYQFIKYYFKFFFNYLFNYYFIFINKIKSPTLLEWKISQKNKKINICHIFHITSLNAGDTLLPIALRDFLSSNLEFELNFDQISVRKEINKKILNKINTYDLIIIGGGGLFMNIDEKTSKSNWQFNISNNNLSNIKPPIIVYAVGYNQFRGQAIDLTNNFNKSLNILKSKSIFFGLRNKGSISEIKKNIFKKQNKEIFYQPCPTCFLDVIYRINKLSNNNINIAINIALDRVDYRYGADWKNKISDIISVIDYLRKKNHITLIFHSPEDSYILNLFSFRVRYQVFFGISPSKIISMYQYFSLVIGTRGHSQMIPFGLGIPIISIITHNKVSWFLRDNNIEELGIEVGDINFKDKLIELVNKILINKDYYSKLLNKKKYLLAQHSLNNIKKIGNLLSKL